jgi:hypothetical protein
VSGQTNSQPGEPGDHEDDVEGFDPEHVLFFAFIVL